MEYVIIGLAALTAAVGAALIARAIQLGKQFAESQARIAELELRVKKLTEAEVVPAMESIQGINRRLDRLSPRRDSPGIDVNGELDGWAEYLPKVVDIVSRFSKSAAPEASGRNPEPPGEP
jgi:hypothetical protein